MIRPSAGLAEKRPERLVGEGPRIVTCHHLTSACDSYHLGKNIGLPAENVTERLAALMDLDHLLPGPSRNMNPHGLGHVHHGRSLRVLGRGRQAEERDGPLAEGRFPVAHIVTGLMGEAEHEDESRFGQVFGKAEALPSEGDAFEGGKSVGCHGFLVGPSG